MSSTDSSQPTPPGSSQSLPVILDPQALQQVLLKDVRELTDLEIDSLILTYREQRKAFGVKEATKKPREAKPTKGAELASLLGDLKLDI